MGLFKRSRKHELALKEKKADSLIQAYPKRQQVQPPDVPVETNVVDTQTSEYVQRGQAPIMASADTPLVTFGHHGNIVTFDAFSPPSSNVLVTKESEQRVVEPSVHKIARDSCGAASSFNLSTDGVGILSCESKDSDTEANSDAETIKSVAPTVLHQQNTLQSRNHQNLTTHNASDRASKASTDRNTIDSIPRPIALEKPDSSLHEVAGSATRPCQGPKSSCEEEENAEKVYTSAVKTTQPPKVPDFLKTKCATAKSVAANYRRLQIPQDSSDSASTVLHKAPLILRARGTSTDSAKKESILSVRLQELQNQYTRLNLDYHKLTSEQLETKEILIDIKSELCTTNLTTTQNCVEIADLQDSRRSLAEQLSSLKATVSQCKEDLLAIRQAGKAETLENAQMATKTTVDVTKTKKARPKRMTLNDYKEYCAQRYTDSQVRGPVAEPPSAIKFHNETSELYSDSSDDDRSVLEKTGTAQSVKLPAERPALTRTTSVLPAARQKVAHGMITAPVKSGSAQTSRPPRLVADEKVKAKSKMPNDVLRSIARDKLSSIAHFRKHKENHL